MLTHIFGPFAINDVETAVSAAKLLRSFPKIPTWLRTQKILHLIFVSGMVFLSVRAVFRLEYERLYNTYVTDGHINAIR